MKLSNSVWIWLFANMALGARHKDIATLEGVRGNQLLGYGMVVGISGTGDKGVDLTSHSLGMALRGLGIDVKKEKLDTKNAASVVVLAELPPWARVGQKIEVTISSIGAATSLEGGTLVLTPLKGADGQVYAVAQGKLTMLRKNDKLKIVSGILDHRMIDAGTVKALAALPDKQTLRGQLVGVIAAPLRGFVTVLSGNLRGLVNVLNAIKDAKA